MMAFSFLKKTISIAASGLVVLSLAACHGILDDLYDQPEAEVVPAKGQLLIDATSWTDWYYVDLKQLQQLSAEGKEDDLRKAQTEWTPYPIPMSLTGDADGRSGQYLYWFDVFGAGLSRNEFRSFVPCDPQPEPDAWSFAVHRNNVPLMAERPCVHPTPPWISCRRPASRFTIWSSLLTNGHKTRCGTARSRCFWDWSRRRESASTARSPRGCRYRFLLCRRRLFTTATSLSCVLPMAPMRLCNSKTTFRLRARNAG